MINFRLYIQLFLYIFYDFHLNTKQLFFLYPYIFKSDINGASIIV